LAQRVEVEKNIFGYKQAQRTISLIIEQDVQESDENDPMSA
jgi:hypothetical protein